MVGLMLAAQGAVAQSTGIHFIVPEYTRKFQKGPSRGVQYGIGMQHDLNERLSLALDVVFEIRSLENTSSTGTEVAVMMDGNTAYYGRASNMLGVTYRSAYAFSDNDEGHLYLGSFIGIRRMKQRVDLDRWTTPSGYGYSGGSFVERAIANKVVVPVGLRLGVRGGMEDTYFMDLYFQAGYCIGGGTAGFSQAYLDIAEELALAKFTFTAGLAIGFGW